MTPEEIMSAALIKIGLDSIDSFSGHPDLARSYLVNDQYLLASYPWRFAESGARPAYYEMALIARIAADQSVAHSLPNGRVDTLFRLAAAELRIAKLEDANAQEAA